MRTFPTLLTLFLLVPVLEIYLLIQIGGVIGALPTIGLVVLTAVLGAALLRQQGLTTLMRLQSNLDRGDLPAFELLEGAVLLVGGALLLTPGFFTDAIGFAALLPMTRRPLIQWLMRRSLVYVQRQHPEQRPGFRTFEGRSHHLDD